MQQVTQLMTKGAHVIIQKLRLPGRGIISESMRIAGNGIGNHIVETTIERPEFFGRNGRLELVGEVRDSLAYVAIIVHHLVDGKALLHQLAAVRGRSLTHLERCAIRIRRLAFQDLGFALGPARCLLDPQGSDQLLEKERDALFQLRDGCLGGISLRRLVATALDELVAMLCYEFMQHASSVTQRSAAGMCGKALSHRKCRSAWTVGARLPYACKRLGSA